MSWKILFERQANKDLKFWLKTNKKIYQKCLEIIAILKNEPTSLKTTGNPEWLKYEFSGCMSRKITQKDRCVN